MKKMLLDVKDQLEYQIGFIEDMILSIYLMEQGFYSLDGDQKQIEMSNARMIQEMLEHLKEKARKSEKMLLKILKELEE